MTRHNGASWLWILALTSFSALGSDRVADKQNDDAPGTVRCVRPRVVDGA